MTGIFIAEFITVPHEISGRLNVAQTSPFERRQCYLTRQYLWAVFQRATVGKSRSKIAAPKMLNYTHNKCMREWDWNQAMEKGHEYMECKGHV